MAAIYLDNLVKPQNIQASVVSSAQNSVHYTYTDLHLDLEFFQNIGAGFNSVISNDIKTDHDVQAIRNAIFNIFHTRPGEKILNPNFGCSLEQFLFQPVSDFRAKLIGDIILNNLTTYEPRVTVNKILVKPNADSNLYEVYVNYLINEKGLVDTLQMNFNSNHQSSVKTF